LPRAQTTKQQDLHKRTSQKKFSLLALEALSSGNLLGYQELF